MGVCHLVRAGQAEDLRLSRRDAWEGPFRDSGVCVGFRLLAPYVTQLRQLGRPADWASSGIGSIDRSVLVCVEEPTDPELYFGSAVTNDEKYTGVTPSRLKCILLHLVVQCGM